MFFDDEHACPKKLTEVPCLRCRCSDMAGFPVLDVPGQCLEVWHVARLVLADVVVRCLLADIILGGGGSRGGRREGGRELEVACVVVLCVFCATIYLLGAR